MVKDPLEDGRVLCLYEALERCKESLSNDPQAQDKRVGDEKACGDIQQARVEPSVQGVACESIDFEALRKLIFLIITSTFSYE